MYYNVAQLLKEPIGSTRIYRIDQPVSTDDGDFQIIPQGQLSLMRTDKGVWASARLNVRHRVICSRCLKRFPHPIRIVIEEEYLPTVDVNTGQSLRVPERAEGFFTIDQRHGLELKEALRQYTLTNQPMKPLCHQDCRGLCPSCGTDRNENPCLCQEGAKDARWTPLLELLGKYSR